MLEASIGCVIELLNNYERRQNRRSAEEYYKEEIAIIEKASGKSWKQIKEIMGGME